MILPTLLSAGTLAVAAHAFLLPLEVVETAEVSKQLSPFVGQSQELDLDCSSCPFALESTRHGLHEWSNSQKSDLKLKFATGDNKLRLNGVPFYPIAFPQLPPLLSAKQVAKNDDEGMSSQVSKAYQGDLKLSYSLEINDIKHFANPDEQEADVVTIVMSIMGLDDQMVKVDDIHIKLLKEANSAVRRHGFSDSKKHKANGNFQLHIIDVFPVHSAGQDTKCTTVMCRFFAKLAANVSTAKATAQSAAKTAAKKVGQKVRICCLRCMQLFRNAAHHGKHREMPHGAHNQHNGAGLELQGHEMSQEDRSLVSAFLEGVWRGFTFVLFPMLAGIAFGIVAGAVGMMVGQLVVMLWNKFRPARKGEYERVEDLEDKENLPAYEDLEVKIENENEKA